MALPRLMISTNFYGTKKGIAFNDSLGMGDLTDVQLTRLEVNHGRLIDSFKVSVSDIRSTGIG